MTDSTAITVAKEKLASLISLEELSAVEATWRQNSRELVVETVSVIFSTGYYAATEEIKDSFFLFVEDLITEMSPCEVLDKPLNLKFKCFLLLDVSIEDLIVRINNTGFTLPAATNVRQSTTDLIEKSFSGNQKL